MPAIGKDLSKIRTHLGLSIQDMQHYTKIPVPTLKSIENGSIFDHPEESQTYIRSFVRSYGRALKIDDDIMIKALDQTEKGNYNHLLLQDFPELRPEPEEPASRGHTEEAYPEFIEQENIEQTSEEEQPDHEPEPKPGPGQQSSGQDEQEPDETQNFKEPEKPEPSGVEKKPGAAESAESKDDTDTDPRDVNTSPSVKSVDWADVGRKFSEDKKHTPVWIIGLVIILIIAAFVGYFLYNSGYMSSLETGGQEPDMEQVTEESKAPQNSLPLKMEESTGENTETAAASETVTELDDVLQITVFAAYNPLGPVRIWSDIKPRLDPYWLEQGVAMHFEFRDTIRIRGSYADLLLFKNGHLIENLEQQFLQQENDYLELTRSFFTTNPKWATAVAYELPDGVQAPDSIASRPTF